MPQSPMTTDLLEPLQIIPHLLIDLIGQDVRVFALDKIFLTVQEPVGNLELSWVLHDRDDTF